LFYPIKHLIQLLKAGSAVPFTAKLGNYHQSAFGKHFDVFVNGGPAYFKVLGHGIHVQWVVGDHIYDLPPGGVGYCLKYVSTHMINRKPLGCKYNATQRLHK
jgi:hypothetical protein